MSTSFEQLPVGEIVRQNFQAAGVFRKYGIDFCCGGGISLEEACSRKQLDINTIGQELEKIAQSPVSANENYNSWSIPLLVMYIKEKHHTYVRNKQDELLAFSSKVAWRHGESHPENAQIHEILTGLFPALIGHLEAEEQRVFPLILQLHALNGKTTDASKKAADLLRKELQLMENDHDEAGTAMKQIRELSHGFSAPEGACTTYRVLYQSLEDFEADLHKHVHLENNILFPKAAALLN